MSIAIPMLDLMFFLTERQETPRHVGALVIFERPERGGADTPRRVYEAYRKARPVSPFNRVPEFAVGARPAWREVDAFDMDWHVRRVQLPQPGSDEQLHALVASLHEPMFERDRPGWQVHVIDGLERHRFALFLKVHHSLVDGESGIVLLCRSLATSPRDRRIRTLVETRLPGPPPEEPGGAAGAVAQHGLAIGLASLRLLGDGLSGLRGYSTQEARPFTAPATPMNDPIQSARTLAHTTLSVARIKAIAGAHGASVNDVVLCVVDAALNRYLREIDRPPAHALVASCPVSLQDPAVKQASTQVSILWVPLAAPAAPIGRRLREIKASTQAAKQRLAALPREAAYAYSVLTFAVAETLSAWRTPLTAGFLPSNVLVSNVRGPADPLYLGGARLEALCPFSTLIGGIGLNVTFMSCAGTGVFGFTANAAALPGAGRLARCAEDAIAALERSARRLPRRPRAAARAVSRAASGSSRDRTQDRRPRGRNA